MAAALRRIAGNKKLYMNLLRRYVERQEDAVERVREALRAGDAVLAERIAHTLKGLSGNIGAVEAQAAAGELELSIHDRVNEGRSAEILDRLALGLGRTIEEIRLAMAASAEKGEEAATIPTLPAQPNEIWMKLKLLIEESDSEAVDFLASVREQVVASCPSEDLNRVETALKAYDFPAALRSLKLLLGHREGLEIQNMSTILIVDDEPDNIALLSAALKGTFRTKVAITGENALDLVLRGDAPDLILLDIIMPDMDGYEVCRRLKLDPKTADIPVIFLTAKSDTQDEREGLELGAVDYITKPLSLPIVLARINTHLHLKSVRDFLRIRTSISRMKSPAGLGK